MLFKNNITKMNKFFLFKMKGNNEYNVEIFIVITKIYLKFSSLITKKITVCPFVIFSVKLIQTNDFISIF